MSFPLEAQPSTHAKPCHGAMQPVLIGIGAYLVVQFAVGMFVSRRIASETDYLLAGRRLGVTLGGVLDLRDVVRRRNRRRRGGLDLFRRLLRRLGGSVRLRLCLIVLGVVIAAPLWRRKYTTFGDLFRERYSPGVERLAVLLMVPTSVLWAAAQIRAFGSGRQRVVERSRSTVAITAAAGFVVVYTVAGGLLADVDHGFRAEHRASSSASSFCSSSSATRTAASRARRVDRPERLALFSTADATPLETSKRGPYPYAARCWPSKCCRASWAARPRRPRATRRCSALRSYLVRRPHPRALGLAGPPLARTRRAEQLVIACSRAAPVDVPVRAVRRRADLGDSLDGRQLPAGRRLRSSRTTSSCR